MKLSVPFVKMYSTDWCHDCKAMMAFFEDINVVCKILNVDSDPQAIERLKEICGGKKIVPTLEIEGKTYINPSVEYVKTIVSSLTGNNI